MNATTLDDLRPRPPGGLPRAAVFALIAHVLLVLALSLGVNWRSSEPAGVEAELWASVPQIAAPRAVPPEPVPTPATPPKPVPQAKVEPPPPPPNRDADIAREKRAQKEKLEKQRLDEERKEDALRKQKERKQKEQAEQAKAEAEADKREADKKKAEVARLAKQEAIRKQQLDRVMAEAAGTGTPGSTGTAAQSAGPSAGYAGRIKARIKPNVVFADDIDGNPLATVEIKLAPDGSIVGRRLVKSSGVAAWDEAALRAIDKTEVLPRDTDGHVPPVMTIEFRPRDF